MPRSAIDLAGASRMPLLSSIRSTEPSGPGRRTLAAEEQVGCDVQRRRDGEGLVDGLDAGLAGVLGALEVHDLRRRGGPRRRRARCAPVSGLDQRRLAGAVVADDGEDLAGVEVEVDAVETDDPTEGLDQAAGREHRGSPPVPTGPGWRCWSGTSTGAVGCGGSCLTFRIHWSIETATMTSTPTARTRHWSSTPASESPLRKDADDERAEQRPEHARRGRRTGWCRR